MMNGMSRWLIYAAKNDLLYINLLDYLDEMGLDFNTDTYDAGLHLNLARAEEKTSVFLESTQEG